MFQDIPSEDYSNHLCIGGYYQPAMHRLDLIREECFSLFNYVGYFLTAWVSDSEITLRFSDNDCRLGCFGLPRQSNKTAVPAIATTNGFIFIRMIVVKKRVYNFLYRR